MAFNPKCRLCPRLSVYLKQIRHRYPAYHAGPVAAFGSDKPRLLIVGLAPGLHGANATGRPFTGDYAGILLYRTLYRFGFSSSPVSEDSDDGLDLFDCRITNAVKCLPPDNKPTGTEVRTCNPYLKSELESLRPGAVVLALGSVAHNSVLRAFGLRQRDCRFCHGVEHLLPGDRRLVDSYHCSRYNTQTGRLTEAMFEKVLAGVRQTVDEHYKYERKAKR